MKVWEEQFLCLSVTKTTAIWCTVDNGDDGDNDDDGGDGDDESWYLVAGELVAAARNV